MELWQEIKRVSDRYGRHMERHLASSPVAREFAALTSRQHSFLLAVSGLGEASCGELARYFHVTPPSVTGIIRKLTKAGLITSRPGDTDRRVRIVELSALGQQIIGAREAAYRALADDIQRWLTNEELEQYSRVTAKICDSIEAEERRNS